MNIDEFYLRNIKTHFPVDSYYETIYFADSCNKLFRKKFLENLPLGQHVSTVSKSRLKKDRVDVIVDLDATEASLAVYPERLNPNGLLIAACPNRGIKTIDTFDKILQSKEIYPLLKEPFGKLSTVKNDSIAPRFPLGRVFPNSKLYSPLLLMMYLNDQSLRNGRYIGETTLNKRLKRAQARITHYINNHKISEYIATARLIRKNFTQVVYDVTFIGSVLFKQKYLAKLPVYPHETGKIRLGILMSWIEVGGVERVMLNILKGLDRNLFEVHLITSLPGPQKWHEEFSEFTDVIVHVGNLIEPNLSPKFRTKYIAEYIERNQLNVLLITNSTAAYEALPILAKKEYRYKAFDLLHTHGTPQDQDAFLRVSMPFEDHINKRIVINEYLKRYYYTHYPVKEDRIQVIYNGLDDQTINEASLIRSKISPLLNTRHKSAEKTITYIGRLEFDKSPERLIELARLLKENGQEKVTIIIAGDGTLRRSMEDRAAKYGLDETSIKFLGYVAKPMELMAQSDFTILTSNSEGIPMSILESMVMETPSIAPAVGGIPEIIDDGIDGFLVNFLDKETEEGRLQALYEATVKAINLNPTQKVAMKKAARQKVDAKFCRMAQEYSRLLSESN